jgi:monoamine oxidase
LSTLIIGAGVAGLSAAHTLTDSGHSAILLEARDRIGGRVYTNRDFADIPVEFGAEFIHGNRVPTWDWVRKLGLRTLHWRKTDDSMVRLADNSWLTMTQARSRYPDYNLTRAWKLPDIPAKSDESLEDYLRRLGLSETQLTYDQRAFGNASGEALRYIGAQQALDEWHDKEHGEGDYRILDGYDCFIRALAERLDIRLNTVVEEIEWGSQTVRVHTSRGEIFEGENAVITLPLGVLQANKVRFSPELPADKQAAIRGLRMGPVIKLIYRFPQAIQPSGIMAVYSALTPPMWWSPSFGHNTASHVWTAFASGDYARELLKDGEDSALDKALATIRKEVNLPNLTPLAAQVVNWPADPFALGGYSVAPPGQSGARAVLAQPTSNLHWAGEATSHNAWAATVHGAYVSGQRAAKEILK